jgi:DNA-binding MurR/RpiR family transcriptional regulator
MERALAGAARDMSSRVMMGTEVKAAGWAVGDVQRGRTCALKRHHEIEAAASGTANALLVIRSIYESLSTAERKVADTVLEDPQATVYSSIMDLASTASVGETTIIRFCRKLGFRGFQEFKLAIAQDMVSPSQQVYGKIEEHDSIATILQKILAYNLQVLQDTNELLDHAQLTLATDALLRGRRLFFFGVGSSGKTAEDAQYRFMRLGFDAHFAADAHIIAMNCALAGHEDVVFAISSSGSTKDLVDAVRIARDRGAFVICLTNHARSPITSYADVVLAAAGREGPLQGGAFASKLGHIHVLDILSTLVSVRSQGQALASIEQTAKAVLDKLY